MPAMRSAVDHHATPASASSSATSPSRARTAAGTVADCACGALAVALISRRPGEARPREAGAALVGDPERVDVRPRRTRHGEVGPRRVEDPGQPRRLAGLDPERHDVLDLEVDG